LFGHIGDEILKNRGKKYIGLQQGMKLNLATNLVLNYVCLVLSFLEHFQPIIDYAMCTVAINVFEPSAFNPKFQYFIPLFNKIS
jgi:hypothetical protein